MYLKENKIILITRLKIQEKNFKSQTLLILIRLEGCETNNLYKYCFYFFVILKTV